jgi:hypothetical protein
MDPAYLPSLKACGRVLLRLRRLPEAIAMLDAFLLEKQDWQVLYMRGRCLQVRTCPMLLCTPE